MATNRKYLEYHGWKSKTIKYNACGHTTREGWIHPSKAFDRPVSEYTAVEFQKRYDKMYYYEVDRMENFVENI